MKNKVVFAAAGNGKTYSICSEAKASLGTGTKCVLMISYTNEGVHALENEYRKQNDGVIDNRIIIKSWYSFMLSEFIKPYQCTLQLKYKVQLQEKTIRIPENYIRSIAFYQTEEPPRWYNQEHLQYYVNTGHDLIPDRVSMLAIKCNENSANGALRRLEGIYSHVFIDELQDYAGWDLEIIRLLFKSAISIKCVGDYKQATYRTNNSLKNKQYRDEAIKLFFEEMSKNKHCQIEYANTTRRFNQAICDFINLIHSDIESTIEPDEVRKAEIQSENSGIYIIDTENLSLYCNYYNPTILRYNKRTKIMFEYAPNAVFNYGGSKGATFERVVIVPVKTVIPFIEKQENITANQTRSKFYVACTRARTSVVFAIDKHDLGSRYTQVLMDIGGKTIPVYKFKYQ